jgi:hypothetical protein
MKAPRSVVGPLFTRGGTQSWYLVCFSERVYAIPQGSWFALKVGMGAVPHPFGLIFSLFADSARRQAESIISQLMSDSEAALQGRPGSVRYAVSDIARFQTKTPNNFYIHMKSGTKHGYGAFGWEFGWLKDIHAKVKSIYPALLQ